MSAKGDEVFRGGDTKSAMVALLFDAGLQCPAGGDLPFSGGPIRLIILEILLSEIQ
jgi:hypothetical protein